MLANFLKTEIEKSDFQFRMDKLIKKLENIN